MSFKITNKVMHVDEISLEDIARQYGTPLYVYSASEIKKQFLALQEAFAKKLPEDNQPTFYYACKANSNIAILKLLKTLGAGLEIVSEGEFFRGLKAGFAGKEIITTSFGKTEEEIEYYLQNNIYQINIEAEQELDLINNVAKKLGKKASVAFRLNPNIAGGGHNKISTGRKEDKFGNTEQKIIEMYGRATELQNVIPVGLAVHIGSQVTTVEAFKPAYLKLSELVKTLRSAGHTVSRLDIGGGFPIIYKDENLLNLEEYAQWVEDIISPLELEIQMEPGRYLVGNAGILLSKTVYVKSTPSKNFLVLDCGMSELIRPTLYEAYHNITPVIQNGRENKTYDIVGPICESGDIFAKDREMETVSKDDLVIIHSAGAYGYAMASNYNSRPKPAEILVDGKNIAQIKQRQTLEDLTINEEIPSWLED